MRTVLMLVVAAACSSESPQDEPVPAVPLAGTLNGMPWTAGSANAKPASTPGEMRIWIYPDAALGCSAFGDDPYVAMVFPWLAGAQPINFGSEAVAFIYMDATAHVVLDGRIELPDAPTAVGATPLLRLRASFQDGDDDMFVEGEIAVQICE